MPHVYCLRLPEVIWLYVAANAAIALAYFCIPPTLVYFIRKRRDMAFSWMFALFGIFILACGTTHIMDIITLWHPIYRFDDMIRVVTAISSIGTAILLVQIMPQALLLPNPQQLREEIEKRTGAQRQLELLNEKLEGRVLERTVSLNDRNAELAQAVEELRYQLELNRAITTHAGDSILVTDSTGLITFANPEAERAIGYNAAELLELNLAQLLQQESAEAAEAIAAALQGHKLTGWATVFRRKNNSLLPVECSAGPIEVAGKSSGCIFIIRDSTERLEAERAVVESEAKYRTLVEAMPQLVWSAREDGHADYFSKQLLAYTGRADCGDPGFRISTVIHPDDLNLTRQAWQSAQVSREIYEVEHRIRRSDGSWRWFKTRAVMLPSREPATVRWLGTSTDIDTDKKAAAALAHYNEDLKNLAFAMAHDLHEPVRILASQTQLLTHHLGPNLDQVGLRLAQQMVDNANRMRKLLRDIRVYSETLSCPLQLTAVSLSSLLDRLLSQRQTSLAENKASVTLDLAGAPSVQADPELLRLVFEQLLENALAYRRPGEALGIHVSSQFSQNEVVVAFEDNGVGIAPEYHDRVFELFKRLHKHDQHPGSGIGLAMCRKILARHGHQIWVRSDAKRPGTTFYFSLPPASHAASGIAS